MTRRVSLPLEDVEVDEFAGFGAGEDEGFGVGVRYQPFVTGTGNADDARAGGGGAGAGECDEQECHGQERMKRLTLLVKRADWTGSKRDASAEDTNQRARRHSIRSSNPTCDGRWGQGVSPLAAGGLSDEEPWDTTGVRFGVPALRTPSHHTAGFAIPAGW